jgi:hypothetical protein
VAAADKQNFEQNILALDFLIIRNSFLSGGHVI